MFNPEDFRARDPVDPMFPQQRGIGGQGFPSLSPVDLWPEMGEDAPYQPPQAPPEPTFLNDEQKVQHGRYLMMMLRFLLSGKWPREVIGAYLEEQARNFYRPVHLPPWPEMPIAGTQVGGVGVASPAGAGTQVALVTISIPRGFWGFVAWIGQDTQNDAAGAGFANWASLSWDVCIGPTGTSVANMTPVPGLNGVVDQLGQIELPTRINVFVPEGYDCMLRVTNNAVGVIPNIKGRLHGWYWPQTVRMSNPHVNAHIRG